MSEVSFGVGLVVGASLTAVLAIFVGSIVRALSTVGLRLAAVIALTVLLIARETGVLKFPLPENRRLIPYSAFRFGPLIGPLEFGIELGSGVRTYVTSSLPYALLATVLLVAEPLAALVAAVGFAMGRQLMLMVAVRYDVGARQPGSWSDLWDLQAKPLQAAICSGYVVCLVPVLFVTR